MTNSMLGDMVMVGLTTLPSRTKPRRERERERERESGVTVGWCVVCGVQVRVRVLRVVGL